MTTKTKSKTKACKGSTTRAKKPATATKKLVWRHVRCRVRHTPDYLSKGWSHIEIIVITPMGAPIPITVTGYRSHFLDEELLAKAGGPVRLFLDWLEREAQTRAWAKAELKWRQLELFRD